MEMKIMVSIRKMKKDDVEILYGIALERFIKNMYEGGSVVIYIFKCNFRG